MHRDEERESKLYQFALNITEALKTNDRDFIVQAFYELGSFLQNNYRTIGLEQLQDSQGLKNLCKKLALPPLDFYLAITEARIRLFGDNDPESDPDLKSKIIISDAFAGGLNIYGYLMGIDRVGAAIDTLDKKNDDVINQAKDILDEHVNQILVDKYRQILSRHAQYTQLKERDEQVVSELVSLREVNAIFGNHLTGKQKIQDFHQWLAENKAYASIIRGALNTSDALTKCVNNISTALEGDNTANVVQRCYELGEFFERNYPDSDMQDPLFLHMFIEWKLPPLHLYAAIGHSKIDLHHYIGFQSDPIQTAKDVMGKGLVMYGNLMGSFRVDTAIKEFGEFVPDILNQTADIVDEQAAQIALDSEEIARYEKTSAKYKIHLESQIRNEVNNMSDANICTLYNDVTEWDKYNQVIAEPPQSMYTIPELKVLVYETLLDAYSDKHFREELNVKLMNKFSLVTALKKHQVITDAQNDIFQNNLLSTRAKINKFHHHLTDNKTLLTKRRDSALMTFVKGLGVFAASILGVVVGGYFAYHRLFGDKATHGKMYMDKVNKIQLHPEKQHKKKHR